MKRSATKLRGINGRDLRPFMRLLSGVAFLDSELALRAGTEV